MPPPDFRIISIGTLAAHPLWEETIDVRTGHATTTLITTDEANILVDPGLPAPMIAARLSERCRIRPHEVTHVFLTSFTIDQYRGVACFEDAEWLLHEPEREAARRAVGEQMERAREIGDPELLQDVAVHERIFERCRPAPDNIVPGVDLFPLPGVTPGACGLLLPLPRATVLICGDAIATVEHLQQGKVLPSAVDIELAQASFREAIDIADIVVPGRDNMVYNPLRV